MTKMKPLAAAFLTLGALSSVTPAMASTGATEDRIAELERQIAELRALVASNQQTITVQEENISANTAKIATNVADIEEARPMAKGTKFTYGGYIQLDAITSDYSEGKPNNLIEDFYVPSLVPTSDGDGDSYTSTNIHAKTSRFFFTTKTKTDAGDISSRFELDFMLSGQGDERISNSWSSRMRHAFVKWDYSENSSIMAGQSWTTFFNVGALPDVLDFVGPTGTIFVRQPQIRWTMGGLQLAVENPATRLNDFSSDGNTYYNNGNEIPDLVARYNGQWGDLSWSAAALGRTLKYEERPSSTVEGDDDDQFGYGLSLAGKWMLGKNDLRFMVNYGDALGRYMGLNAFNDGYVKANGDIDTFDQLGAFIAYRHYWSPRWRSTFSASIATADNPDTNDYAGADSLAETYESYHVNLNYLPAPKLSLGGELLYATKELENGNDGDLTRVQFAVKYAF